MQIIKQILMWEVLPAIALNNPFRFSIILNSFLSCMLGHTFNEGHEIYSCEYVYCMYIGKETFSWNR